MTRSNKSKGPETPLPPDQDQRLLILEELDRNMLVEAAAGTGKTTSMIGRMIALLRSGSCRHVGNLAAVTFTRKAAGELRTRFQISLEKEVREVQGQEKQNLDRALANIEQCFIGTIHSFCARLLRERPVEAGVNMAFEELDEEADRRLRHEAWDTFTARLLAHDPEGLLPGLDAIGMRISDLRETFMRFADFPDVDAWPVPAAGKSLPGMKEAVSEIRTYIRHMQRLASRLPESWGRDNLIPAYRRLPRIFQHYDDLNNPVQVMDLLSLFAVKAQVVQKQWKKDGAFSGEEAKVEGVRWEVFRQEVADPLLGLWRETRYGPAMNLFFQARRIYDHLREEQGQLNFQDLLIRASGLLRQNPHVRLYFQRRYPYLLVDEFQDTDPVQAEVMLLLTAGDPHETNWRKCRPRPGSLFVVGDPKQSIYRFRRADIVTYNEVKEIIRSGEGEGTEGIIVELSANFRTTFPIIEWVNRVFSPKDLKPVENRDKTHGKEAADEGTAGVLLEFPEYGSEESPSYVPLQKGRIDGNSAQLAGIYVLSIPEGLSRKEEAVPYESDRIARTIRHALDSGMTVSRTRRQIDTGLSEEVVPSDFMIVTWKTEHLSMYARTLQEYGIPHQATGSSALNELNELKLLHTCLKAVVHPDDPVALLAVLRSELFGLSDPALYAFKKAGGRFSYNKAIPYTFQTEEETVCRHAFEDAFFRLKRYALWFSRLPALAALEKIVNDLGLMVLAGARPGGDVEAGSLAKALEILRGAFPGMWTTAQLVDYLGQLVNREERYDGISALSVHQPAVRIMNLHKVKGLEAPVVFLACPFGEYEHPVDLHIDRSGDKVRGYMAMLGEKRGNRPAQVLATPSEWDVLSDKERRFARAERLRLRYVAATRAGSALIVTQHADTKKKRWNPWQCFQSYLPTDREIPDPGPLSPPQVEAAEVATEEPGKARDQISVRISEAEVPTFRVSGAKAYALTVPEKVGKEKRTEEVPRDSGSPESLSVAYAKGTVFPGVAFSEEGEHGVEWGSVIHELLELAMKNPGADLFRFARTVLPEQGLGAHLSEKAVEVTASVMGSEMWQRALQSEQCLTEVPFQILVEETDPVPTLLRGAMDLVFKEKGGWVLVDYKTDIFKQERPDRLVDKYTPQVRLYADAWETCTGEKVKEIAIYFLHGDLYVPVKYGSESRQRGTL